MKHIAGQITGLMLLAALLMPAAYAATNCTAVTPAPSMSVAQAMQAVRAAATFLMVPPKLGGLVNKINAESMHVSRGGIVFDGPPADQYNGGQHRYTVTFTRFTSAARMSYWKVCDGVTSDPSGSLAHDEAGDPAGSFLFRDYIGHDPCSSSCQAIVLNFVTALNSLRAIAVARQNAAGEFHRQATGWRALTPRPPLPEEVRVHRILAENAVKEKKLDDALEHYEAGLDLYYTWPQGHFNAALIAAEIGFYEQAVEHMQSYLELVPDAPDAEAARDQIVIWRDKAGH